MTRLMIDIARSSILFGSIFITASLLSSFLDSSIPSIIDFVNTFSYERRFFLLLSLRTTNRVFYVGRDCARA